MLKKIQDDAFGGRSNGPSIAIIGGGPAGLSLARLLGERGLVNTTIFEALPQVGGKSYSVKYDDERVCEMGTCYATFSHRITTRWMKELGIEMKKLGEQTFGGGELIDYVKGGDGKGLTQQFLTYFREKKKLLKALEAPSPSAQTLDEAAMPIVDWLEARSLGKIVRFMQRSTTNIAYGFLDELPTVQALRWNDMEMLLTGVLKQLKLPVSGWGPFWEDIASSLTVHLNTRVVQIDRHATGVTIKTGHDETFEFDYVVCAIPIDDFAAMTDASSEEHFVTQSIAWNGYTTTMFVAENWFKDVAVEGFVASVLPNAERGQLLSARYEGYSKDFGGHIYLAGQLSGDFTQPELRELLIKGAADRGAKVTNVILQKMWKYHAQYAPDAIRAGLIERLRQLQGQNRTWYTGATFSHEAVSHIVNFNAELAQQMQVQLPQTMDTLS
ncbi:MAG: FAD-dependent oxidoreductase [Pseudomonadota bacterium]